MKTKSRHGKIRSGTHDSFSHRRDPLPIARRYRFSQVWQEPTVMLKQASLPARNHRAAASSQGYLLSDMVQRCSSSRWRDRFGFDRIPYEVFRHLFPIIYNFYTYISIVFFFLSIKIFDLYRVFNHKVVRCLLRFCSEAVPFHMKGRHSLRECS